MFNDFKNGYQPRNNTVKDEKSDLLADCHSTLARWRNHFAQILNVYWVGNIRQTEILKAEPLVPEPLSAFEFEMGLEKLKEHKSSGIY